MLKVNINKGEFKEFELAGDASTVTAEICCIIKKCLMAYLKSKDIINSVDYMVICEDVLSKHGFKLMFDDLIPPSEFKNPAEDKIKEAEAEKDAED